MRELIAIVAALFAVPGCRPNTAGEPSAVLSASVPAKASKTVSAEVTGYNHTDKTIGAFYVNGEWGGNITPGAGGGKFVCCIELPNPWQEGYTVTITWEDHEGKMQKREVSVPKYDPKTLSDFNVHFLRSGEIKVFALRFGLRHRDYPLTGPEAELKPGVPIDKVI